jgi:hypothetical protein
MSMAFSKLFESILESTVWCEPLPTRVCWISMLAMADRLGRVSASVPGLAKRAGISVEETNTALERFMAPDHYSRTPDREGRRIEVIDGGWRLLNYAKYREIRDEESRRDYQRNWDRDHRQRRAKNPTNPTVSDRVRPRPTQAEAEAETETSNPPSAGSPPANADFATIWQALPKRTGNNPRARAERAFRARLKEGHTASEMLAGAQRYALFCNATGKTGTEFAMQGATFLGPEKPFTQAWATPEGAARWDQSDDGLLAKAKELGISTRGETVEALKALIRDRLHHAKGNGADHAKPQQH